MIGWFGIAHVIVIVIWMIVNLVFGLLHPVTIEKGDSLAKIGIEYYSDFQGYLGFDHGSKGLVMIISILLPIGLFTYLKKDRESFLPQLIGLIAGCMGFLLYGLSLILQATAVEYAFSLYNSTNDLNAQSFAIYLYEWSMLEGGLSVSIYIIANILLGIWVITHSKVLYHRYALKKFGVFGYVVGGLLITGYIISWFYLMQAKQNMHDFNEVIGMLFTIWILLVSIKMVRGKIRNDV